MGIMAQIAYQNTVFIARRLMQVGTGLAVVVAFIVAYLVYQAVR